MTNASQSITIPISNLLNEFLRFISIIDVDRIRDVNSGIYKQDIYSVKYQE